MTRRELLCCTCLLAPLALSVAAWSALAQAPGAAPAETAADSAPADASQAVPRPKPAPAEPAGQTFAAASPAPYAGAFQAVPRPRPEDAPDRGPERPPAEASPAALPTASVPPRAAEPGAAAAAEACFAGLTAAGIAFERVSLPAPEDDRCEPEPGATISVETLGFGEVELEPAPTANCSVVAAFNNWMAMSVMPAARAELKEEPATVLIGAGYSCRPRNRQAGAKISEHGHANALDVMGFVMEDGRRLEVTSGWKDAGADGRFLRRVWTQACEHFTTVLGPESDSYHTTHFHLDLASRGRSGRSRYCK